MSENRLCVLCERRPVDGQGEHVWPKWYQRNQLQGPGPYPWSVNGEPIRDRRGRPVTPKDLTRVLLPVCTQDNGTLDRRFEKPAKEPLRRLFRARGRAELRAGEAERVALWLMKTLLLLFHPEARYVDPRVERHAIRWAAEEFPRDYYRWLIEDALPPAWISLWMFRVDEMLNDEPPPKYTIPLPLVEAYGTRVEFVCAQVTMHGVQMTLVVHPGWEIAHPLEQDGGALRLWPEPPTAAIDLTALPALPHNVISWLRYRVCVRPGALGSPNLPPLRHTPDLVAYLATMSPFVKSWGA